MNRPLEFRVWYRALHKLVYTKPKDPYTPFRDVLSIQNPKDGDIMQYTGMDDVNGVPIYEGNYMYVPEHYSGDYEDQAHIGEIRFEEGGFGIYDIDESVKFGWDSIFDVTKSYGGFVIGNRYATTFGDLKTEIKKYEIKRTKAK